MTFEVNAQAPLGEPNISFSVLLLDIVGDQLVSAGKLNAAVLDRAKRLSLESNERLSLVLTRLGLISEDELADAFSAFLRLPLALKAKIN